jgi:sugar lactone lactonase YvrE
MNTLSHLSAHPFDLARLFSLWRYLTLLVLMLGVTSPALSQSTAPSNLIATATGLTQIVLTWTNPTISGVNKFKVFRDTVQIATPGNSGGTTSTYTDPYLQPGTSYSYTVQGCDSSGSNCSASSNVATATTFPAPTAVPGAITTIVGSGLSGFSGDGGPALSAALSRPTRLARDASGNMYFGDSSSSSYYYDGAYRIRKVDNSGTITTVAGAGGCCSVTDGTLATSAYIGARGLAVDSSGNLHFVNYSDSRIYKINANGILMTVAGGAYLSTGVGDGGQAVLAMLSSPSDVVFTAGGNFYIADTGNYRIRKVTPSGIITTIAGTGTAGVSGDGGLGTLAQISSPQAVTVDVNDNVYFADTNRIRKISNTGTITTVAGLGFAGFSGDGGPATAAQITTPKAITLDAAGQLYLTDGNRVRKIDTSGVITTIAGTGISGYSGDYGLPTVAKLNAPNGIAVDASGTVYIADTGNNVIRKFASTVVKTSQTISSFSFTPSTLAVGGTTTASATASSGLAVTFRSASTSVCTVASNVVSGVAAGLCAIGANQAGNDVYAPAPEVLQVFSVTGVLTVPGAPTILAITPGPGRLTLTLLAPSNTGGGPITSYGATCSASGHPSVSATSATTTVVVPGLVPGVSYACTATANNASYSSPETPATPAIPKPRVDLTPILMLLLD